VKYTAAGPALAGCNNDELKPSSSDGQSAQHRHKKNAFHPRFFLTLFFAKTIPSLVAKITLQLIRLITGRTGRMATKKAAKKVAKKAAKKK
jgi:hypothetical protein